MKLEHFYIRDGGENENENPLALVVSKREGCMSCESSSEFTPFPEQLALDVAEELVEVGVVLDVKKACLASGPAHCGPESMPRWGQ